MNRMGNQRGRNKRPYSQQQNSNSDFGSQPSKSRRISEKESVDPQSFRALSKIFQNVKYQDEDPLSKKMWDLFQNQCQREVEFNRKIDLWNILDRVLSKEYGYSTHVFGSTINGFGSRRSDMDICVFTDGRHGGKKDAVSFLAELRKLLRRKCGNFLHNNIELIAAKVPILKMYDQVNQIEIDLSCANTEAVRNSHLLLWYSQMDWRIRPLVMNIKFWAQQANINDAKVSTLSSYTLTLMILHYLQCGTNPPVITSLHDKFPNIFHTNSNVFSLPFLEDMPKFTSPNKQFLGALLYGFFQYYNEEFDFAADCGSVRLGQRLHIGDCYRYSKEKSDNPRQWDAYICMEEPFVRINTGRAVIKRDKFDEILNAFDYAQKVLYRNMCLDCLNDKCRSSHDNISELPNIGTQNRPVCID